MSFNESSAELNHRYGTTFIGIRNGEEILPLYVREFGGEKKRTRLITGALYHRANGAIAHDMVAKEYDFDEVVWAAPKLGYIQCADKVTKFVVREPEPRPAKIRGLKPNLTTYWYWSKERVGFTNQRMSDLFNYGDASWDIYSVYNPQYLSAEAAWTAIRNGEWVGAALSRNIALYKTKHSKNPLVFYKDLAVGLYDKESNKAFLRPAAHMLFEEMSNYMACEKVAGEELPKPKPEQVPKAPKFADALKALRDAEVRERAVRVEGAAHVRNNFEWMGDVAIPNIVQVKLDVGVVGENEINEEDNDEPNW
jgi:hypothetical protein